jgi:hypothetical protein
MTFMSCVGMMLRTFNEDIIAIMIGKDPSVLEFSLINHDDFLGLDCYIEIIFKDGNIIEVSNVEKFGKGKKMTISFVNDYTFSFVNKSTGMVIEDEKELKFLSTLIGVQLNTISDIVKYYYTICFEMEKENWIDLSYYKQDNETYYEASIRAIAEDIFPFPDSIVTVDGQDYFVYKRLKRSKRMGVKGTPGCHPGHSSHRSRPGVSHQISVVSLGVTVHQISWIPA